VGPFLSAPTFSSVSNSRRSFSRVRISWSVTRNRSSALASCVVASVTRFRQQVSPLCLCLLFERSRNLFQRGIHFRKVVVGRLIISRRVVDAARQMPASRNMTPETRLFIVFSVSSVFRIQRLSLTSHFPIRFARPDASWNCFTPGVPIIPLVSKRQKQNLPERHIARLVIRRHPDHDALLRTSNRIVGAGSPTLTEDSTSCCSSRRGIGMMNAVHGGCHDQPHEKTLETVLADGRCCDGKGLKANRIVCHSQSVCGSTPMTTICAALRGSTTPARRNEIAAR